MVRWVFPSVMVVLSSFASKKRLATSFFFSFLTLIFISALLFAHALCGNMGGVLLLSCVFLGMAAIWWMAEGGFFLSLACMFFAIGLLFPSLSPFQKALHLFDLLIGFSTLFIHRSAARMARAKAIRLRSFLHKMRLFQKKTLQLQQKEVHFVRREKELLTRAEEAKKFREALDRSERLLLVERERFRRESSQLKEVSQQFQELSALLSQHRAREKNLQLNRKKQEEQMILLRDALNEVRALAFQRLCDLRTLQSQLPPPSRPLEEEKESHQGAPLEKALRQSEGRWKELRKQFDLRGELLAEKRRQLWESEFSRLQSIYAKEEEALAPNSLHTRWVEEMAQWDEEKSLFAEESLALERLVSALLEELRSRAVPTPHNLAHLLEKSQKKKRVKAALEG